MKRYLPVIVGLLLLAGCTSSQVEYCRGFGVEGTTEYGNCLSYYDQQSTLFSADRRVCELEADLTYPPSLYDYGGYGHSVGGFSYGGRYYGGSAIRIEPDFRRNAEIDRLRMRIIEPCMQAQGWKSGKSWQAGRQAVKPQKQPRKRTAPPAEILPWLN
jgi:hypothetical protein